MTVTFLARNQWGAGDLHSGYVVAPAQFVGLVAHHTVMVLPDYDRDGFTHGDIDDISRYMRTLQPARPDLGNEVPYSYVVFRGADDQSCVVAEGRGRGVTGAHTEGYNSTRYGIAFAGNADTDLITPGVLAGYRFCGRQLVNPSAALPTIGHRDTKATACPGAHLYSQLAEIQPPFTEVTMPIIPPWAAKGVYWARATGLIRGDGDVNTPITTAQVVTILLRFAKLFAPATQKKLKVDGIDPD